MLPLIFLSIAAATQAEMEGFIVGGSLASINIYPHSAFLTVGCVKEYNVNATNWICGSSILNQKILLTAGHCLYSCGPTSRIIVHMGSEHRTSGVVRSGGGFLLHERYIHELSAYDIGLVMMKTPVKFNSRISRVAIMKRPPYSEQAKLAGWGQTNEQTKAQGINLKQVDQRVLKHSECQELFGKLPRGTICASSKKISNFAASGDSGSALVVRGFIQIGLVSFKKPATAVNIIIYTDVGYHYEWITYNARRLYCV